MTAVASPGFRGWLQRVGYARARLLVLAIGTVAIVATAVVMAVRKVETAEIAANLLFLVVFAGVVFLNVTGGLIGAALAIIGYVAFRYSAIHAVGFGSFTGLILSRSLGYAVFGVVGRLANRQLQSSLTKLELYDQIDDGTGLFNARFFVQDTDLEMSRSRRYQTIFSVAMVEIPSGPLQVLGRRARASALRQVGRLLHDSVRTVDRAVHSEDTEAHLVAVVLPETGPEGARVFVERLGDRLAAYLAERGAPVTSQEIGRTAVTFPDDEAAVEGVRQRFGAIDRREHPEATETP